MPIEIHGKQYVTVAERIQMLHDSDLMEISLNTDIIHDDEQSVVMKTTLEIDGNVFTGIAQEFKGSSNINKTSAHENCETSAVGRALGFAGYGSVESIASADEVAHAVANQEPKLASDKQIKYIKKLAEEKDMEITDEQYEKMTMEEAGNLIEHLNKEQK